MRFLSSRSGILKGGRDERDGTLQTDSRRFWESAICQDVIVEEATSLTLTPQDPDNIVTPGNVLGDRLQVDSDLWRWDLLHRPMNRLRASTCRNDTAGTFLLGQDHWS